MTPADLADDVGKHIAGLAAHVNDGADWNRKQPTVTVEAGRVYVRWPHYYYYWRGRLAGPLILSALRERYDVHPLAEHLWCVLRLARLRVVPEGPPCGVRRCGGVMVHAGQGSDEVRAWALTECSVCGRVDRRELQVEGQMTLGGAP